MIVNALLLFQMLHFLVAYLILKYILLRPALVLMKRMDREVLLFESNVALLSEEAARREAVIDAQWKRHCRVLYLRYDKKVVPSIQESLECLPRVLVEDLPVEQMHQMRSQLTQDIVHQFVDAED